MLLRGDLLIAGAHQDRDPIANLAFSGSVRVYRRGVDGAWTERARLTASDPMTYSYFGSGLAWAGDTLAVAAPGHEGLGTNSGAVYLFRWIAGSGWRQTVRLLPEHLSDPDEAWFGLGLALRGDELMVGSPGPFPSKRQGQLTVHRLCR